MLKKILGTSIVLGILSAFPLAVSANTDSFTLGTPIDLTTGSEVTELSAGQYIAIPVDIDSDTGYVGAFALKYTCDDALSQGIKNSVIENNATVLSNILSITENVATDGNETDPTYYALGLTKTKSGLTSKYDTYMGDTSGKTATVAMMSTGHAAILDGPECYLLLTVDSTPANADSLNFEVVTLSDESYLSDTVNDKGSTYGYESEMSNDGKLNATQGAFKITLDADELDYYVKEIYVNGVALTEYVKDSETVYSFPVRVNRTDKSTDSLDITVTAEVYSNAEGTEGKQTVELASATIAMDSSVTDYVQVALK